jgi:hypothetical protein
VLRGAARRVIGMRNIVAVVCLAIACPIGAAELSLDSLELINVKGDMVKHRGKRAVRLMEASAEAGETIAIIAGSEFGEGVIEAEIAGLPRSGAQEGARGFIGIAFHVQEPAKYESFYLRPTNGRANDQLRRNHSTQYISHPDYPWHRLRKENPGVYESYVDLVPGEWTKIRIVVSGTQAQLYVHGAEQPVLIVNDLKHGASRGKIALWIGQGTEGYFRGVKWSGP